MARTSKFYTDGVDWIAQNDEPEWQHIEDIQSQTTVVMLAHLHGKEPVDVATDVYNRRIKLGFWA